MTCHKSVRESFSCLMSSDNQTHTYTQKHLLVSDSIECQSFVNLISSSGPGSTDSEAASSRCSFAERKKYLFHIQARSPHACAYIHQVTRSTMRTPEHTIKLSKNPLGRGVNFCQLLNIVTTNKLSNLRSKWSTVVLPIWQPHFCFRYLCYVG